MSDYNFKHYAIITGSRSGSSHLCDLIESTNRLGTPDEYFNTERMEYLLEHVFPQNNQSYQDKILWHTKKANFVVGYKINHIDHLLKAQSMGILSKITYWIWLKRNDKILQAISRYISWVSGVWDNSMSQKRSGMIEKVKYDFGSIRTAYSNIIDEEKWINAFLIGKNYIELEYESDVVDFPNQTITAVLEFLNLPIENLPPLKSNQKIMRTNRNTEWKNIFIKELASKNVKVVPTTDKKTLKSLIKQSIFGTVGYIKSISDLDLLERRIIHNLPVLKKFKSIIVATNYSSPELIPENAKLWKKYFHNVTLIDSEVNRGHVIGTADLDNLIFDYCKKQNIQWLCKSSNDVTIEESILDREIGEADFYYLNGITSNTMSNKYNFDFDKIIKEDFHPQTNFYFINVSKCDYLNDKNYVNKFYEKIKNVNNYNGKPWEYGFSCEDMLRSCVDRNLLSKYNIASTKEYLDLLHFIKDNNINDSSHKNIMISDICHLHSEDKKIHKI